MLTVLGFNGSTVRNTFPDRRHHLKVIKFKKRSMDPWHMADGHLFWGFSWIRHRGLPRNIGG